MGPEVTAGGEGVEGRGARAPCGIRFQTTLFRNRREPLRKNGRPLAGLPGLRNSKFLPACDRSGRFVGREEGRGHQGSRHNPGAFFLVKIRMVSYSPRLLCTWSASCE